MKPVDGDRLLSEAYTKAFAPYYDSSEDDVCITLRQLSLIVDKLTELRLESESALPAYRYKDFEGYTHCSVCKSKLRNPQDPYCSHCGHKFV